MQTSTLDEDIEDETRRRIREIAQRARKERRAQRSLAPDKSRPATLDRVKQTLVSQPEASEFLLSLFYSSLKSHRRPTIADPWPSEFTSAVANSSLVEKRFESAETFLRGLPSLQTLSQSPNLVDNLPPLILSLLDFTINPWVNDAFNLVKVSVEEYDAYVRQVPNSMGRAASRTIATKPSYVFRLDYDESSTYYQDHVRLRGSQGFVMGYHGSPLENFHSIVRNGLDDLFSKSSSIYGKGIYLSEDRDVASSFVKSSKLEDIKYSFLGEQIGCLACCEVIKHPNVRFGTSRANQRYTDSGILVDGENQLPSGYIVAGQADHVLTRFVLVYTHATAPHVQRRSYNICLYLLLIYLFALLFLWISRDKRVVMSWRYMFKL